MSRVVGNPVREGFEPSVRFYSYNGLANRRIRPLCHRTWKENHRTTFGREPTRIFDWPYFARPALRDRAKKGLQIISDF